MKRKMKKKLIAFMLCMVLVICNSVSILADAPAAATTATEKQVSETKTVKNETTSGEDKSSDDNSADKDKDTSSQSDDPEKEESDKAEPPETKTTEKKEETTEATTEAKEDTTTATTKAEEGTSEAEESSDKEETTGAEDDSDKKDETTEASEDETAGTLEETTETTEEETGKENSTEAKEETAVSELTYTNDDVVITVSEVAEGAIPEGAELKVVPILKDDADTQTQYAEVEQKIQEKAAETETEIKGFLAYDITFMDEDGNEIEPNSEVKVSIEYKQAAIPAELNEEDAKDTEVSVMHLEEDADGNVSQVVDMGEAGKIDALETTDAKQVEKVEVKTESFSSFVLSWTAVSLDTDSSEMRTVQSRENNLYDSIAEGYWPNGENINDWQIVNGAYQKENGHADDQYTVTEDGMFRLQKKVIPTETENEFYIYLNMEPVMSWEEVFKRSTIWICNNNWQGEIDSLTENMTADQVKDQSGGHVSKLVSSDIKLDDQLSTQPNKEVKVHTIRLETSSGSYEEIKVDMHYGLSQNSSDSFTILYSAPNTDKFVKLSDISFGNGVLTIPAEAWGQMVSGSEDGDLSLLTGTVVPETVTDVMGDYIEYLGESKTSNGQVSYDYATKTLTWSNFSSLEDSEDENDYALSLIHI